MVPQRPERPIRAPTHLSLAVCPRLPSKRYQCWPGWTQIVPDLGGCHVDHFHSPLLQEINALMLWSGLSLFRKFLKPLNTSALVNCTPAVMSAELASLFVRSFSLAPTWPGQQIRSSLCSRRLCMGVSQSGPVIPGSTFCCSFIEPVKLVAWVICGSLYCVCKSLYLHRSDWMRQAPMSLCIVLSPCLSVNAHPHSSLVIEPSVQLVVPFGSLFVSISIVFLRWLFQLAVCAQVDRLVGLVVKASASRAEGPRFESR